MERRTAVTMAARRILDVVTRAVFAVAFGCLAVGLVAWVSHVGDATALSLLTAGLVSLLALPLLKLASIVAVASAERDWLTLFAAVAVVVILGALTLRDALVR